LRDLVGRSRRRHPGNDRQGKRGGSRRSRGNRSELGHGRPRGVRVTTNQSPVPARPQERVPVSIGAPRPMCSRVTTAMAGLLARGSPPCAAFPAFTSGVVALGSPLTVAGAAAALEQGSAPRSRLIPEGNHRRDHAGVCAAASITCNGGIPFSVEWQLQLPIVYNARDEHLVCILLNAASYQCLKGPSW